MLRRYQILAGVALICLAFGASAAEADLVITYDVNITNIGPITVGDSVNWEIFATVSQTGQGPSVGTNNGIAAAVTDLQDSTGEILPTGSADVQTGAGEDFQGYLFPNAGTFNGTKLQNIGAAQFEQDGFTRGEPGDLGPHLLATGSYTVMNEGIHTLSAVTSASTSQYWSTPAPGATNTPFDMVAFGPGATFSVLAVPEPSSVAMMGVAALGAFGVHRRRKAVGEKPPAASA